MVEEEETVVVEEDVESQPVVVVGEADPMVEEGAAPMV
jgi:hypothetical protein